MTGRWVIPFAVLYMTGQAVAQQAGPAAIAVPEHPAECQVANQLIQNGVQLKQVAGAIAAKHLDVLVVGAGSSVLPGPNGAATAYPARLQAALQQALPGVAVKVTTDIAPRRTAAEMVSLMPAALAAAKPALVIWQTGTVDAMQGVELERFGQLLEKGIAKARAVRADVILVNSQYSPRTESMIALGAYGENMRWVAAQQDVPVFDRFSIMKLWGDLGTFDLYSATKKLDIAERVHDCIGRLLADLIVQAARTEPPPGIGGR